MKILHLTAIIVPMFFTLFVTSQAYAPCIEGPGINCNNYPSQTLSQIHFDKLNYDTQDKPIITISGVPSTAVHLEIDDLSSNIMFEHDLNLFSNGTARFILDISYYKSGGYSATATSLMSKVTTSFTVGMTPSGGMMGLNVDKNSYLPGDKVSILGTGNSNTLIQLSLIDPYGTSIRSAKIFSDKTGHFSLSNFTIPNNAVSGIWQIGATGGMMHVRTQIVVNSTNHSSGIKTDKAIILSPLQQFKSGISAKDIKCASGFQIVIKTRNHLPACVKPEDISKLVERGWADKPKSLQEQLDLENTCVGTNACRYGSDSKNVIKQIQYYGNSIKKPKVSLFDYYYDEIDKDNATVSIGNQTYYQTTLNRDLNNLSKGYSVTFQDVAFSFPEGVMVTPGGDFLMLDVKFQDGSEEVYGRHAVNPDGSGIISGIPFPTQYGPHVAANSITVLGDHIIPQAGLTIYHDSIKLLVSTDNQTIPIPQCVSNIQNQYAVAGFRGDQLCPVMNFQTSAKIVNYNGFYGVYKYLPQPNTSNFVLEPGHNGTIMYRIDIGSIYNWGNESPANNINITNYIEFMHDAGMHDHPGIIVSADPDSEIIQKNDSALVTVTFTVSKDARPGTYWVDLPPSFCAGGQVIILAITNCEK